MRSNILVASALAIGAIAKPIDKRYYVTKIDVDVVTKVVYVMPGAATAAAVPTTHHFGHSYKPKSSSYVAPVVVSTSVPAPLPVSSTAAYTPPAASSAAPIASSAPASSAVNYGSHKTGTIQATFSSGADYQAAVIYHHNAARANHNAPTIEWDDDTAANALWSAQQCQFKHQFPEGANNGQNIFTTSGDSFNVTAAITESWYKGEFAAMQTNNLYGQDSITGNVFEQVGHLTALVWKGTAKVGCASVNCNGKMQFPNGGGDPNMGMFTVCNYADGVPNMEGSFSDNVLKPISTTNLGSWLD